MSLLEVLKNFQRREFKLEQEGRFSPMVWQTDTPDTFKDAWPWRKDA
jgi:hypothetical protein